MANRKALGLDELMIVNPGRADSGAYFLGADGTLYHVPGLGGGDAAPPARSCRLGRDGARPRPGPTQRRRRGRFFLGSDGTLYRVVE
jgi:hypothetical protein